MLVGNLVLGSWGDHIKLDGGSKEGWLAGASQFWGMPALAALAVAVVFAVSFKENSGKAAQA